MPLFRSLVSGMLFLLICVAPTYATPVLIVESGQLMGANNIEVNGNLYDVEFVNGSCQALYNGCDDNSDFLFTNGLDYWSAMTALNETVLINDFDTNPNLTNGIDLFGRTGYIVLPYSVSFGFIEVIKLGNGIQEYDDIVHFDTWTPDLDTNQYGHHVYAVFSAASVPTPATLTLVGLGLAGLGFIRRRKTV